MPKPFDLLKEFARFGTEVNLTLRDPEAKKTFALHVGAEIDRAMCDSALLQGLRVEAMFEAVVASLGRCRLIKAEDTGRLFPKEKYTAPDFRVVLEDGANWLVEVKNVYEADPSRQRRKVMGQRYHEKLQAYAAATGGELKLAVFWARWSLWTVITPEKFTNEHGDVTLDMMSALMANELAALGDLTIGTRPPLELRLTMDPARTGPIGPDGTAAATIGQAQVFCGGQELTDPLEQRLVWTLMNYGEWELIGPNAITHGKRLDAIVFRWEPQEDHDQGFETIGTLSRMFARYFAEETLKGTDVVRLQAPIQPDWFEPLLRWDESSRTLPLWRFSQQPS